MDEGVPRGQPIHGSPIRPQTGDRTLRKGPFVYREWVKFIIIVVCGLKSYSQTSQLSPSSSTDGILFPPV